MYKEIRAKLNKRNMQLIDREKFWQEKFDGLKKSQRSLCDDRKRFLDERNRLKSQLDMLDKKNQDTGETLSEELARYKGVYEQCQKERKEWKKRACYYQNLEEKAQVTIVRQQKELEKCKTKKT